MSSAIASLRAALPSWMPFSTKNQGIMLDDKESQTKPSKPLLERIKAQGVLMAKLVPFLWPSGRIDLRIRVILSLLCLLFAKLLSVATPFAYKNAVDVLSKPQFVFPWLAIILYSVGRFGSGLMADLRDTIFVNVQNFALQKASIDTFAHLHSLSIRYHVKRKTGSVLTGIDRGTRSIQFLTSFMLFNILPIILEVIMVSVVLFIGYSVLISIITVLVVIIYVVFTIAITEWRTKFRKEMNDQESAAKDKAVDSLLNFETVKYFGAEGHEVARYNVALEKYSKASERSQWSLAVLNVGQSLVIAVGQFLVTAITAYRVSQGTMTVGDFVLVNTFILQLYVPLNFLGMSYRMIKQSLIDMEQMFDLLKEIPDIKDVANPIDFKMTKGEVEFHNVRFGYKDGEDVLKGVSFKVQQGKQLAIVGESGAGKSTITRLLFRFYEPTGGKITVDGVDIAQMRQSDLRQQVGIVPQDTVLFNDTIRYNINYGDMSITDESKLAEAAQAASILKLIESLQDGWETKVGERGLRLSGGEKQRVSIARVVLKNPTVLVCDEATSALDTKTEREIQDNLKSLFKGKTTSIVIAHRLSTVVDSDEIIVLGKGQIVEQGTHEQLLQISNGHYRRLWEEQSKKEEKDSNPSVTLVPANNTSTVQIEEVK